MRTILLAASLLAASSVGASACAPRFRPATWTQLDIRPMDERGEELPRARLYIDGEDRGEVPAVLWVRSGSHSFRLVSGERTGTEEQILPKGPYRLRVLLRPPPAEEASKPPSGVVLGSLAPAVIDARIKDNLGPIRLCYDRALPANPRLKGKIVMAFIIEPDGSVSIARVSTSNMDHEDVEDCIAETFRAIRFPEPAGGGIVSVKYPLVFNSAAK